MSAKLKLQPFSAFKHQSNNIKFILSNLDEFKNYKVVFENATLNKDLLINSADAGQVVGKIGRAHV